MQIRVIHDLTEGSHLYKQECLRVKSTRMTGGQSLMLAPVLIIKDS